MILVLSSQRFSLLILVSVNNVSLSLVRSNEISRLQNISPYVSLKGPSVRSYEISLVSYVSTFTQFFSLLLSTFFHSLRRLYNNSFSSHLAFSTFLRTPFARSRDTGLFFPRFSLCLSALIRTISLHFLAFLCTLVCSYRY